MSEISINIQFVVSFSNRVAENVANGESPKVAAHATPQAAIIPGTNNENSRLTRQESGDNLSTASVQSRVAETSVPCRVVEDSEKGESPKVAAHARPQVVKNTKEVIVVNPPQSGKRTMLICTKRSSKKKSKTPEIPTRGINYYFSPISSQDSQTMLSSKAASHTNSCTQKSSKKGKGTSKKATRGINYYFPPKKQDSQKKQN